MATAATRIMGGAIRRWLSDFTALEAAWFVGVALAPLCIHLVWGGVDAWPVGAIGSATAGGVIGLWLVLSSRRRRRLRRYDKGMRRCEYMIYRIRLLVKLFPCRTEAETLAALHEMRNCYIEAIRLVDEMGDDDDDMLGDSLRGGLAKIDELYDIQTGSLRRTEANAADFAAAMRALGRESDGALHGR